MVVAAHTQECDVDLQRAVSQKPQQLYLGVHGGGHEVDYADLEGPYVLVLGPVVCHYKNPFPTQNVIRGQSPGYSDWHG